MLGPVQPGVDRPDGDVEGFRDPFGRQVQVVGEDEHRAMIDRQALEAPLQALSLDDPADEVRGGRLRDRPDRRHRTPTSALACLHVARMDEEPVGPALEPRGVSKVGQVAPGAEHGLLHRVLGQGRIPQDPLGHTEEAIGDAVDDLGEGPLVPSHRAADDLGVHGPSTGGATLVGALTLDGAARRPRLPIP